MVWEAVATSAAAHRDGEAQAALAPLRADPEWGPLARVVEVGVSWYDDWKSDATQEALARDAASGGPLADQARTWLPWVVYARTFEQNTSYLAALDDLAGRHALGPVTALWLDSPELLQDIVALHDTFDDPRWEAEDRFPEAVELAHPYRLPFPVSLAPGGAWWRNPHAADALGHARRLAWEPVLTGVVERQQAGDDAGAREYLRQSLSALGEEGVPSWAWMVLGEWDHIAPDDEAYGAGARWVRAAPEERVPELVADASPRSLVELAELLEPDEPELAARVRALVQAPSPLQRHLDASAPGYATVKAWEGGDPLALRAAEEALARAPEHGLVGWAHLVVAEAARAQGHERAFRRELRAALRDERDPWRPWLAWTLYQASPREEWLWVAWPVAQGQVDPEVAVATAERSPDPFAPGIVARSLARRPEAASVSAWIEAHRADPAPTDESLPGFVAGFHDDGMFRLGDCRLLPRWWDTWVAVGPAPRPWVVAVTNRGADVRAGLETCVEDALRRGEQIPATVALADTGLGWSAPVAGEPSERFGACLEEVGAREGLTQWRVHVVRPR